MLQHGGQRGGGPWCALVLLVLAPMVTAGDGGPLQCEEQAALVNGMLELLPKKPLPEWAKVRWRMGLDAGSYQVILEAERDKAASMPERSFSGRVVFQQEPLSLRISPVHAADAGLYETEFEDAGGAVRSRCFRVSVWEPLQPPRVETLVLREERGWCNLSLLCTAAGAGPVSYRWSCSGDAAGPMEPGPRLALRVRGDADPIVCCCNVSNGGSWSSADASISAACPAGLFSIIPVWAVAVAVTALVLPIAIACYWRRKQRKDPPGGHIEQALTVYEEVGKAQTGQDLSTRRNEAASGESTIYAVICKAQGHSLPREPKSKTIYSSVQPIKKSPSLRRKRLDPALISTAYTEVMGTGRGKMSIELISSLGLGWAKPNHVLAAYGVPQTPPITDRAPGSYRPPPLLEPQQDLPFPNGLLLEHPETPSTHWDPTQQSQELPRDGTGVQTPAVPRRLL